MEGRLVDSRLANADGRYGFHLPEEGIYLVEAGASQRDHAAGRGAYGARFVDTLSEEGAAVRDIDLVAAKGGRP